MRTTIYSSNPMRRRFDAHQFLHQTSDMTNGDLMIKLTRLSHEPLVLNSDLIEHMEVTPDTVITLTTGQKLRVSETADEVIARVIEYRRAIFERSCHYAKQTQSSE